jgi:hypothetical protein
MGNFTAYSSNLMDKDELDQTPCSTPISRDDSILASKAVAARSTNSVNTLRNYLLGGAFVLASQVQTALTKEPGFGWEEEMSNTNSTGSAPSTTGPNVGVFYVNNIALTVTAATLSVVILPRINDYIIIPGSKYLWNRFYKTTIDDVPVGPELDNLNFRQRWWGKLYEKASQNLYREKLRDQTSAKYEKLGRKRPSFKRA